MNAKQLRERADELRGEGDLGFCTDASNDPVLVAISTPRVSFVAAIDRAEYDGAALAKVLQLDLSERRLTALERDHIRKVKGETK